MNCAPAVESKLTTFYRRRISGRHLAEGRRVARFRDFVPSLVQFPGRHPRPLTGARGRGRGRAGSRGGRPPNVGRGICTTNGVAEEANFDLARLRLPNAEPLLAEGLRRGKVLRQPPIRLEASRLQGCCNKIDYRLREPKSICISQRTYDM